MVAILSSFIIDALFNPVNMNSSCSFEISMSDSDNWVGILDEINATTTSLFPSYKTNAGLNFTVVRFVNGNGIKTILPFTYISF